MAAERLSFDELREATVRIGAFRFDFERLRTDVELEREELRFERERWQARTDRRLQKGSCEQRRFASAIAGARPVAEHSVTRPRRGRGRYDRHQPSRLLPSRQVVRSAAPLRRAGFPRSLRHPTFTPPMPVAGGNADTLGAAPSIGAGVTSTMRDCASVVTVGVRPERGASWRNTSMPPAGQAAIDAIDEYRPANNAPAFGATGSSWR